MMDATVTDAYTLHLLGMAVEACQAHGLDEPLELRLWKSDSGWWVTAWMRESAARWERAFAPTLADALANLLRDLGVEVPERPDEFFVMTVDSATSDVSDTAWMKDRLRDRYANPATRPAVLALLEEGS